MSLRRLYCANSSLDASLLGDRLRAARITAEIRGDLLQGAAGELPANGLVEVWVPAGQLDAARLVLGQFEQDLRDGSGPAALVVPGELAMVPALAAIERAAARLFSPEDLPPALRDSNTDPALLAAACDSGQLLVALAVTAEEEQPVGFALLGEVDGLPHLAELAVQPEHSRQGLGRSLVQACLEVATGQGARAITLTTYSHLPWNRPFYASMGFCTVTPAALTPGLATILANEAAVGLRADLRIAMRRPLP